MKTKIIVCIILIIIVVIGLLLYFVNKEPINPGQIEYDKCVRDLKEKVLNIKPVASFDQYLVKEVYTGEIAPLDFSSNTIAHDYRTTIKEDLKKGVNFAGHYVISEFRFTGTGTKISITDVYNGKVYSFPYVANTTLQYTSTSTLLIIDPKEGIIGGSDGYCMGFERFSRKDIKPYYFVWENNIFKPLQTDEPLYKSKY